MLFTQIIEKAQLEIQIQIICATKNSFYVV
jgi:hypothetical protein